MKKIHYLLALMSIAVGFTACDPLNKSYKDLDAVPNPKTINYTLTSDDYKSFLPSTVTASKSGNFASSADAKTNIPTLLNNKFFSYSDGSVANITYTTAAPTIKVADTTYANVAYTVTAADYTASSSVTGTTFKDYSAAQVLLFLTYKYPNPVANQLSLLTYTYYESGVTPSAGVPATDSFIYLNGAWQKIYTVSATQYASVGRSSYNQFVVGDAANIPVYLSTFLKNDVTVSSTAKAGDVKYVSFNYYNSSNKVTSQRVMGFTFDGTSWVLTPTTFSSLTFVKSKGVWIPDPTIYYTLTAADYTYIGTNSTSGSSSAKSNLLTYKNFNISTSGTTTWSDSDLNGALIFFLAYKYPSPAIDQVYKLTYYAYNGSYSYPVKTFKYTSTGFVLVQ